MRIDHCTYTFLILKITWMKCLKILKSTMAFMVVPTDQYVQPESALKLMCVSASDK